jgi:prolyl-tRNA synthetase
VSFDVDRTAYSGAMVMTHSDDKGLVLPPRVAPIQVVIVPITKGPQSGAEHEAVVAQAEHLAASLRAASVRVKVDTRYDMRPGVKYFEWERKGLPVRIDIGPRDLQKKVAVASLRHTGAKVTLDITEPGHFAQSVVQQLDAMHDQLLEAAVERLAARTVRVDTYAEMKDFLVGDGTDARSEGSAGTANAGATRPAFFLAPWRCDAVNEAAIKEDCKATIRCYPFASNQQPPASGVKCFYSGQQATHMALFARAY